MSLISRFLTLQLYGTRSSYLRPEKHPDIYQVEHRAEYPQDQNQQAASGKATIAHDPKQYGRRQRAHPFAHCDVKALPLAAAPFDKHVNEQDRHQEVLKKGGIAGADSYSKLPDERIFHAQGGNEAENAPADKSERRNVARKIFPSVFEIGVKDADIKREPNSIDNRLHADSGSKSESRMQQFPSDIQSESVKGNRVGFVFEANAEAFNINNRPTDSANDGEN